MARTAILQPFCIGAEFEAHYASKQGAPSRLPGAQHVFVGGGRVKFKSVRVQPHGQSLLCERFRCDVYRSVKSP